MYTKTLFKKIVDKIQIMLLITNILEDLYLQYS